jgi:hypothetical protein
MLKTTANHHLISTGLAYPTYYRALFPDLRRELTAAAKQARDSGLGVWASDATTAGFDVTGLDVLQDDIVIVPKLFRRLVEYLHLVTSVGPIGSPPTSTNKYEESLAPGICSLKRFGVH